MNNHHTTVCTVGLTYIDLGYIENSVYNISSCFSRPVVVNRNSYHSAWAKSNGHLVYYIIGQGFVIYFADLGSRSREDERNRLFLRTSCVPEFTSHSVFHWCSTQHHALPLTILQIREKGHFTILVPALLKENILVLIPTLPDL